MYLILEQLKDLVNRSATLSLELKIKVVISYVAWFAFIYAAIGMTMDAIDK